MEMRLGKLCFGEEPDIFRLEIRVDVQGQRRLTLFHNGIAVDVISPALSLLQFFAENPKEPLLKSTIQEALNLKDFDQCLTRLRKALEEKPGAPLFIETLARGNGYKFLWDVTREGDLGIDAYPRWRPTIFFDLLDNVTRGKGDEDLRFVTFFFTCGIRDLGLDKLLKKGLRVRIVLVDPKEEQIWEARHGLRTDEMTPAKARGQTIQQIEELKNAAKRAEAAKATGRLELRLTTFMPAAFIAHSRKKAVAGMFFAHCSYVEGPMIEVLHSTELWDKLYEDWFVRWDAGTPVKLYPETNELS
jgi:hypothetical protein